MSQTVKTGLPLVLFELQTGKPDFHEIAHNRKIKRVRFEHDEVAGVAEQVF